jgi:DNA primase catalytic core
MPRIPDDELERLKHEVSLERLAEGAGIALKRHGADLIGLCPFHDDHEPSLVISPDKNLWHCLGACQQGGSVIDWVMKRNGVSFRHAVELLREGISSLVAHPVKQTTVRKLPPPVQFDADDQALLNQVIDYYHQTLKQSPEALAYLDKRGIGSSEAVERFKLGYANRTLGLRLPNTQRKAGAGIRARLNRLGLMRASGHEHFTGSLVIPVLDEAGNVVEVYGRKIRDDLREGTAYHLYLPGPHEGVWNLDALKASDEIILCEALIDALTFWCAGYRNVTAAYGIEGFTADHLATFKQYGVRRVLIAYDRDDAGEKAAERLREKLMSEGIDCYRIQFPKGMDANEYALKVTPAQKSLGVAIRKSVWLGNGEPPATSTAAAIPSSDESAPTIAEAPRELDIINEPTPSSLAAETATPALPATPLPDAPAPDVEATVTGEDIVIVLGDRRYRVRGLPKNMSCDQLKVNVLVSRADAFHVDTLDLYSARARAGYVTQAAIELRLKEDVLKHDLGRVLLKLEAMQEEQIQKALAPKNEDAAVTDSEREDALALLKSPDLLNRLLADFERCGLVGEHNNKLVCYLAACSRKLDRPLGVVIRSNSAAGKTSLMDGALAFMPEEERIKYSAMTGQALFYMGETNLKHKILAIAEEEGASRASYALKLLQSEGELTIASTGKDPATGNLITQEYHVEGPVMVFLTTTAIDIDAELLNRCLELTVDESREQTRAIHQLQRERRTLEGLIARAEREEILALHRNAQRLLRPLAVMNPYSRYLTFPDMTTRLRRDHEKYLTIIDTLALLHQHQREVKTMSQRGRTLEYIEVTLDDIETANQLAHEVLGRSLDELPPHTRRLLMLIDEMVAASTQKLDVKRADYRFSRREVREHVGWGDTQLRLHLDRLVDLEYVLVHRGGRGQSFVYELLYDGQGKDGKPFLPGLIDVEQLRQRQRAA